jgi:RNA polymerase sigma-70 factor (ECF subfamily)
MDQNQVNIQIEKMKAGDRESFNQVFRHYYSPMVRFCIRYVADSDIASEIVQDLFVKLWSNREKISFNTSFESYMLTSVRNSAITYINKERAHNEAHLRVFSEESDNTDPSETLQSNNLEESYRQILKDMPDKRREVFLASRYDGLKYSEIAEKLGISQKTVEAQMTAAIKQLKDGLKPYL